MLLPGKMWNCHTPSDSIWWTFWLTFWIKSFIALLFLRGHSFKGSVMTVQRLSHNLPELSNTCRELCACNEMKLRFGSINDSQGLVESIEIEARGALRYYKLEPQKLWRDFRCMAKGQMICMSLYVQCVSNLGICHHPFFDRSNFPNRNKSWFSLHTTDFANSSFLCQ